MSVLNVNKIADASGGVLAPISSVMRNRIINGAMVIDQRNAGASVTPTNGQYTLDRWIGYGSVSSKYTIQQNAGSVTPPAGFTNYLGVTSTSAHSVSSGDYFLFRQFIEGFNVADLGWGTANAKTVTLSFWVRSSLTGTFGGTIQNSAGNRSYPFTYTITSANTWEYETITIAGDTSGTWLTNNGTGVTINFGLGAGSTYSGTAGAWAGSSFLSATGATSVVGTNGATFYITGVQLEVGIQATSFEYRQVTTELQLCQRYYEKSYNMDVAPATNTGDGRVYVTALYQSAGLLDYGGSTPFRVSKRANPTIAYWREDGTSGSWGWATDAGSGNLTPLSNRVGTTAFSVYAVGSGFSNTSFVISGHWTASSEL